ncbi:MAG: DUF721 domain-containing protein [Rhodospirillales bacterium]|nr:DUF721 domain-containing protein [Rhodospirillales bacterium]
MATTRAGSRKTDERRRRYPIRAGLLLPEAAARAYRKHGFAEARLITDWAAIVGERLADVCVPEKLARDRALTVRVVPAFALELQHLEPRVLERIATFFGHPAVSRLKLRQGEILRDDSPRRREPRPLTEAEQAVLDAQLDTVDDTALRAVLERLGRAVLGSGRDVA